MSTITADINPHVAPWKAAFEAFHSDLENDFPEGFRKDAFAAFEKAGFPSTKNEEWKYSSVLPLLKMQIPAALVRTIPTIKPRDLESFRMANLEANLLVFVNGFFAPTLSEIKEKEAGIFAGSLAVATKTHPDIAKKIAAASAQNKDSFSALNAAFFQDGACIVVPENKHLKFPVKVLFLHDTLGGNLSWNVRNFYSIGKNASASIIHVNGFLGSGNGLGNICTDGELGENASAQFIQYQVCKSPGWLIEQTNWRQARDSRLNAFTLSGGMDFIRNNLHITLEGQNAHAELHGVFTGTAKNHVDNHTLVDHAVPNCTSNELYIGVMNGNSTGVFNGKIMVRKDAQKTAAFQSNKNLILSPGASINTKPQLEIFADDVKCSHGATLGRLNEEALFYLRARGIGEAEARNLLTSAFTSEVISQIPFPTLAEAASKALSSFIE